VSYRQDKQGQIRLGKKRRGRLEKLLSQNNLSSRMRKRAQILLLSEKGWSRALIIEASGSTTSTISRTRRRYIDGDLDLALHEKPRPGAEKKLTKREEEQVIALVCSEPPEGFSRWSVRLLTETVQQEPWFESQVGRETI